MYRTLKNTLVIAMFFCTMVISGCAEWRANKTIGENIDDSNIVTKIKTNFVATKDLPSKNISVSCQQGVVQLSGFVNKASTIAKAENIAHSVKGVKKVINNLTLSAQ